MSVATAAAGALVALVAGLGKFSRRLGDATVERLYVASYAFMTLAIILMAIRGFLRRS